MRDPLKGWAREDGALAGTFSFQYAVVSGAGFGLAHDDYQGSELITTMRSANSETLLIAQIETAKGLENVEAIAAVESAFAKDGAISSGRNCGEYPAVVARKAR